MGSFKLKLVVYFSVISLLPFAAAFGGLETLTERNGTMRVDGILETGARAGMTHFSDEVAAARREATRLARDPALQRALARRNRRALARTLAPTTEVRVETSRGLVLGTISQPAVERSVTVAGKRGPLGRVTVGVPLDDSFARRLRRSAGLGRGAELALIRGDSITAASARLLTGRISVPNSPRGVEVGGRQFRGLASDALQARPDLRLLVLTPQAEIDRTTDWARTRMLGAMLVVFVLITAAAYLEGRSIVRSLGQVAAAARGIARGRLSDRVRVRGRDEFASLGRAFNDMADQLQARLDELEQERRRGRETTLRFGEALAATHDSDQLLRVIVESAVESTGATLGRLVEGGRLLVQVGSGSGEDTIELPLSVGRETFGTLVLVGDAFSPDQRETASWLVGHAVIALANAQRHRTVEEQALVDGLTGLANRRLCSAAIENELARAERFDEPLALVLADLDDFKRVNDRFGHPTGDEVLKSFASILQASVREIDLAGRWGGEEFALVLPGTDVEGGRMLAERVRRTLAEHELVTPNGQIVRVTASFGVSAFPAAGSQEELVAASDSALYEAKRTGKNRVATTSSSEAPSSVLGR